MKKMYSALIVLMVAFLILPSTSLAAYKDVPAAHSNYGDIMYLLEKGVIEESNTYGVTDIVTREEVAVMVAKAVGLDGTQRATKFKDVTASNPNSGYIQSAVDAGIINGYQDGTFKPNNKVTRGHMAAFIARAFDLPYGTKTFKDVAPNNTAYEAVKQLAAAGVTSGYEDGTFRPSANLTRAHISAFLARAIRYNETLLNPTILTGSGDAVTKAVTLKEGFLITKAKHEGESNFIVTLYTSDGEYEGLIANEIGDYNSKQGVMIPAGNYVFEVQADGEWSLELSQHVPVEDVLKQGSAKGFGNDVVFMELAKGTYTVTSSHDGKSNFIIWANESMLLANEIGQYSGSNIQKVSESGLYMMNINADGNWTFTFKK